MFLLLSALFDNFLISDMDFGLHFNLEIRLENVTTDETDHYYTNYDIFKVNF